jgi:F-type H+-transporting ATPase subunit epsilon
MPDTLELEVATPERELVREQVTEVQVPAAQGYIGVLPGHAPLMSALGIGTLTYVVGGAKRHLSVHGGFLEILENHVRVLADVAERAEEIDIQRAKAALERSQREALNPAIGVDPAVALAATLRARARLATAEKL